MKDKQSDRVLLHGIFGYDKYEDHMEWRKHPKIKDADNAFAQLAEKGIVLMPEVKVNGVAAETGYFHVNLECS